MFQTNQPTLELTQYQGQPIQLTFFRHNQQAVHTLLLQTGWHIHLNALRTVEHPSTADRAYIIAQKL